MITINNPIENSMVNLFRNDFGDIF
jgi:hypothetical protein